MNTKYRVGDRLVLVREVHVGRWWPIGTTGRVVTRIDSLDSREAYPVGFLADDAHPSSSFGVAFDEVASC